MLLRDNLNSYSWSNVSFKFNDSIRMYVLLHRPGGGMAKHNSHSSDYCIGWFRCNSLHVTFHVIQLFYSTEYPKHEGVDSSGASGVSGDISLSSEDTSSENLEVERKNTSK